MRFTKKEVEMSSQDYITQAIRAELAARGLTKTGLADFMQMDRSYLTRKLSGSVPLNTPELDKISQFLGIPMWNLFSLAAEREVRDKKAGE